MIVAIHSYFFLLEFSDCCNPLFAFVALAPSCGMMFHCIFYWMLHMLFACVAISSF